MYRLENISLHNWYLVEAQDIEVRGLTAVIGATGAGKSSILDAIQTVASGNNRNVMTLNASAGEVRQRSVRDYILGCVADVNNGTPARERCEATVVLCFRDDETGKAVSAGLMMEADRNSPLEETRRFVADGMAFRIADFTERDADGGEYVIPHDEMLSRMRTALGPKRLLTPSKATDFVAEFLSRMRPNFPPDAKRFLRNFGNALTARSFSDPTSFVRRHVLEPMPLDIQRVRESIATWRGLEAEVARIERMLVEIRPVHAKFASGLKREIEAGTASFAVAHLRRLQAADIAAEAATLVSRTETDAAAARRRGERAMAAADRLREERAVLVEAQRSRSGADQAALLEQGERAAAAGLRHALEGLAAVVRPHTDLAHLERISVNLPISSGPALRSAVDLRAAVSAWDTADWLSEIGDLALMSEKSRGLIAALPSLRAQQEALSSEIVLARREADDLEVTLGDARRTGSLLSRGVTEFIELLRRHGIKARALPELVEISDDSWTYALECVLGAGREALFVAPDDVARAFDLLHQSRAIHDGVRIADSRRMRGRSGTVSPRSLAAVVLTDDDVVRAFVNSSAERYVRVDTDEEIRDHSAAITRAAKSTSGMALRVFRDRLTILGKVARSKSASATAEGLAALRGDVASKTAIRDLLASAQERLARVEALSFDAVDNAIEAAFKADEDLAGARRLRSAVLTADDGGLAVRVAEADDGLRLLRVEDGTARMEVEAAMKANGDASARLVTADRLIAQYLVEEEGFRSRQSGDRVDAIVRLTGCGADTIATEEVRIANEGAFRSGNVADRAGFLSGALRAAEIRKKELDAKEQRSDYLLGRAGTLLADFIRALSPGDVEVLEREDVEILAWLEARQADIEGNELLPHKERLSQARVEMESSLREDLLTRLSGHFSEMDKQLRALNDRLARFRLVGQRYRFQKSVNAAMRPLHALVRKVGSGGDGVLPIFGPAAEAVDETEIAGAREQLERILSSTSDPGAFADYREYFEFEMEMIGIGADGLEGPPEAFSRIVGKLSGGQQQAPYYVAIAASMASAYYPGQGRVRGGDQGMGLMVFDEGFAKLDIANTQQLVSLFRSLGLQVLVAAPEEKRVSLLQCVDSVINVNRRNNSPDLFIDTVRIGAAARDAMAAANPATPQTEDEAA